MSKKILKLLKYKRNNLKLEEIKLTATIKEQENELNKLNIEKDKLEGAELFLSDGNIGLLKVAINSFYLSAIEENLKCKKNIDYEIKIMIDKVHSSKKELEIINLKIKAVKSHTESINDGLLDINRRVAQHNQNSELLEQILYGTN